MFRQVLAASTHYFTDCLSSNSFFSDIPCIYQGPTDKWHIIFPWTVTKKKYFVTALFYHLMLLVPNVLFNGHILQVSMTFYLQVKNNVSQKKQEFISRQHVGYL